MTTSPTDDLVVDTTAGVLTVRFARPATLNALTPSMVSGAADAVEGAPAAGVRVVVLRGTGRAFTSGADLGAAGLGSTADPGSELLDAGARLTLALREAPVPVIAAVNGPAAGIGVSFALAADLVVAAESAYFLLAFSRIGLMPDGGASALVAAAIGRTRAMRMALLAEPVPAATALDWGLITEVVADDRFDARIADLAALLATGPTSAYARTKHAVNASTLAGLPDALRRERDGQVELLRSDDLTEGVAAFRERRPARFVGR